MNDYDGLIRSTPLLYGMFSVDQQNAVDGLATCLRRQAAVTWT